MKADAIVLTGTVKEACKGLKFKVDCVANKEKDIHLEVFATLSGKLNINHIRVLPGDSVNVEVSPTDITKGRIIWRNRA